MQYTNNSVNKANNHTVRYVKHTTNLANVNPKPKCFKCDKEGHIAKHCRSNPLGQHKHNKQLVPKHSFKFSRSASVNEVMEEDLNPILNVTAPNGQSLGTIDYKTMTQYFDNMGWIDSIDIFSGLQVSGKIQVDNVHTQKKIQAFTNVAMCPTNKEGKGTAQSKVFKCKLDSVAGTNVMSLKTYREVNPSEFDGEGNCVSSFNNDMTILKGYTGTTIKQHGVRGINCFWDRIHFQTSISYCGYRKSYTAWFANNEKNGIIYRLQVGECGDSRHSCRVQEPSQV